MKINQRITKVGLLTIVFITLACNIPKSIFTTIMLGDEGINDVLVEDQYDAIVVPDEEYDSLGDITTNDEVLNSPECVSDGFCVSLYGGDAISFQDPPDDIIYTNYEEFLPPTDVVMSSSEGTTTWYTGRILWKEGDWVEITASGNLSAIGVQVFGDETIGWAKVVFDGVEVWRGNTSTAWTDGTVHAVYIEVFDFGHGSHTLRIESLGIDGGGGGISIPVSYFGLR